MDKEGHTFLGWATTSTSKRIAYRPGANYKKNSSLKLYAVWEADTYKISYNSNGGGSVPAVQTKIYGKALKLSTLYLKEQDIHFRDGVRVKDRLLLDIDLVINSRITKIPHCMLYGE